MVGLETSRQRARAPALTAKRARTGQSRPVSTRRARIALSIFIMALLAGGLAIAYGASRHPYFSWDVELTRRLQALGSPALSDLLSVVNEVTNFYPGLAIWLAAFVVLLWRRRRVEALVLLAATIPFLAGEALGVFVGRARPDPALISVAQLLVGNGFPSGHVIGAILFYGMLAAFVWFRAPSAFPRTLATAAAVLLVAGAGLARVYRGAHWPSDVMGGLLLGAAALSVLIWMYAQLAAGRIRLLGVEFTVSQS